ncbi:MAG: hypothetical protein IKD07_03410, partial [Clostridia bacterium]|nr:hypothetical protein [Clostridia bacterium]
MTFLKIFFMIAVTVLMAVPFIIEYFRFRRDEDALKVSRFRLVVFTAVYTAAATLVLLLMTKLVSWVSSWGAVKWIVANVGSSRTDYAVSLYTVIIINIALGFGFIFLQSFVRIGLSKLDVTKPKLKGVFTFAQECERKRIARFQSEEGYFLGKLLKTLSLILSALFAALFVILQIPAVFGADWIPYGAISSLFRLTYQYPVIGLLLLWEIAFFLLGVRAFVDKYPEWEKEAKFEKEKDPKQELIDRIDTMCKKDFAPFYADSMTVKAENSISSANHETVSEIIKKNVETDPRNGKAAKDIFVNALDRLERSNHSLLFNGGFFSEFSMYFFRYLSVRLARGDHLIFVCNNDLHSENVKKYLEEGLCQISSLYDSGKRNSGFGGELENPIWKTVAVNGTREDKDTVDINSSSILITTLDFLCSDEFEKSNTSFVLRVDSVIFTDTVNSINYYEKHLSLLDTKFSNMIRGAQKNAVSVRPIRYLFFDETRTPSLDKYLKNIFSDEPETVDIMENCYCPTVSCYHYEILGNKDGQSVKYITHIPTKENLSVMLEMAISCIAEGASSVSVFMDDTLPYKDFMESIDSYLRKFKREGVVLYKNDKTDDADAYKTSNKQEATLFINEYYYNPDRYSVILAWDAGNNLPSALRKYISMTTDQPSLVILFSSPYLFRDYYIENMKRLWEGDQILSIPKTKETKKDIAKKILVQANAGGITTKELFRRAKEMNGFESYAESRNVNKILQKLLELFDIECEGPEIYQYFEYTSFRAFNSNGKYEPETRITLVSKHLLYDIIHMQDHIKLQVTNKSYDLPLPKKRLTQNYIIGQNLVYGGEMYTIHNLDVKNGVIYARHATKGSIYRYVQLRTYRLECSFDSMKYLYTPEKVVIAPREGETERGFTLTGAEIVAFKAPAEVLTNEYYGIDSKTMNRTARAVHNYSINTGEDSFRAVQTYRCYGAFSDPTYTDETLSVNRSRFGYQDGRQLSDVYLNRYQEGVSGLSIRFCGSFGENRAKIASLAAVMLDEILRAKFPSVADSLAVCAVNGSLEGTAVRHMPKLSFIAKDYGSDEDIELLILEDCADDLGVISDLIALGDELLKVLFEPIKEYLDWYTEKEDRSGDYLWFGAESEPEYFDFTDLRELSDILCDEDVPIQYVDIAEVAKTYVCDFCGKRYTNPNDIEETSDNRIICHNCEKELVGNNQETLKAYLDRAKMYMESAYGIAMDDTYEFCFESTVKIINEIKKNDNIRVRNTNITAKSFIRGKKVHAEYELPGANLSELLVRELTHIWQIKHLPDDVPEDVAKGHIALVGIQYLRHLNHKALADVRAHYYETSSSGAAAGYRSLKDELNKNKQFKNNPFRYLLDEEEEPDPTPPDPTPTPDPAPDPTPTPDPTP